MIKLIVLSVLLNTDDVSNIYATPPSNLTSKTYAGRRKGKGQRTRRRGGGGLR